MSRCFTLEEYLKEFVEEKTQTDAEVRLIVSDQQAQTLGYFLINGLAGFVECTRYKINLVLQLYRASHSEPRAIQTSSSISEVRNERNRSRSATVTYKCKSSRR